VISPDVFDTFDKHDNKKGVPACERRVDDSAGPLHEQSKNGGVE
jgi:hypothetical protein